MNETWLLSTANGWVAFSGENSAKIDRAPVGRTIQITIRGRHYESRKRNPNEGHLITVDSGTRRQIKREEPHSPPPSSRKQSASQNERSERVQQRRNGSSNSSSFSLPSSFQQKQQYIWEFEDNDGTYKPCSNTLSDKLNIHAHEASAGATFGHDHGRSRYTITIFGSDAAVQMNKRSNTTRMLRRVPVRREDFRNDEIRKDLFYPVVQEERFSPPRREVLNDEDDVIVWREEDMKLEEEFFDDSDRYRDRPSGPCVERYSMDDGMPGDGDEYFGRVGDADSMGDDGMIRVWKVRGDGEDEWFQYPQDVGEKIDALPLNASIPYRRGKQSYAITRTSGTTGFQINNKTNARREIRRTMAVPQWEIDLGTRRDRHQWKTLPNDVCIDIEKCVPGEHIDFMHDDYRYHITRIDADQAEQINLETNTKRHVRRVNSEPRRGRYDSEVRLERPMRRNTGNFPQIEGRLTRSAAEALFRQTCDERRYKIVSVDPVNVPDYSAYRSLVRATRARLGRAEVEKRLWHGSSKSIVEKITGGQGFIRDFNRRAAFGSGVYFGATAAISAGYCKDHNGVCYLILARVIVGDVCLGNGSYKRPPKKPQSPDEYDCMVDNLASPSEYVICKDYHAIPEYVIRFEKLSQLQKNLAEVGRFFARLAS